MVDRAKDNTLKFAWAMSNVEKSIMHRKSDYFLADAAMKTLIRRPTVDWQTGN